MSEHKYRKEHDFSIKEFNEKMESAEELLENPIVFVSSCKFCKHPGRAQAEVIWESTRRYAEVVRFFQQWDEEHPEEPDRLMNHTNVYIHINNHYRPMMKNVYLKQYKEELALRLQGGINITPMKRCNKILGMLDAKLEDIASDPEMKEAQRADIMCKLSKTIADIVKLSVDLHDSDDAAEVLEIVKTSFSETIREQIDDNVKRSLGVAIDNIKSRIKEQLEQKFADSH